MTTIDIAIGIWLGAMLTVLGWLIKRKIHEKRTANHVWVEMQINEGKTIIELKKPEEDGRIRTKYGDIFTRPDAFDMYKGKRHFRFKEGNPFPYIYGEKIIQDMTAEQDTDEDFKPLVDPATNGGQGEMTEWRGHLIYRKKGPLRYERFDEPRVIPSRTLATYLDQHDFRDVYSNRMGMMIILILLLIIAIAGIAGLYGGR